MIGSLRRLVVCAVSVLPLLLVPTVDAQSPQAVAASQRIKGVVDTSRTVPMQGLIPGWASPDKDLGALESGGQLTNLHLILSRAPEVQAAFEQLLQDQQNPASSRYHQWLTPEQNAQQFGIAAADLAAITNWLQGQGLTVTNVTAGGVVVTFNGSVQSVQNAFATKLHNYSSESGTHYAPSVQPTLPVALSGVVSSVVGLSEEVRSFHSHKVPVDPSYIAAGRGIHPDTTYGSSNSVHYLSPGDFNVIYNITPAISAGITGAGYRIAVIMSSTIAQSDITNYKALFGVTAAAPVITPVPGTGTPAANVDAEEEADLDVQRAMGTAPGAGVDLLVIGTLSDTNIFAAINYEISTLNDASVNMSFGGCNTGPTGTSQATSYDTLYKAASAQGISIFNSSGDTGAAGCDVNGGAVPASQVQAANILCMSSYVTCVGGTEFADSSANWSSTNNATTQVSALGYISEGAWNEPTYVDTGGVTHTQATASGGGPGYLAKPTWQPNSDTVRDTPDLSFTASDHNGFLICQADNGATCADYLHFTYVIGGTSAASPSMAGIATLIDQKLGARQGNLNPLLYQLAAGASSPFHDVTVASSGVSGCVVTTPSMCNNSTPSPTTLTGGLSGFLVGAGYDEATGLGSLDVNAFLTAASATFTVTPTSLALTLPAGATTGNTDNITLTSVNNFAGSVALTCHVTNISGTANGTCTVSPTPVTLVAAGNGTSTLTILPTAGGNGTMNVTVTGTSGSTVVTSSAVVVNVTSPTFTATPATLSLSLPAGATTGNTDVVTFASTNGFAGSVAVTCAVLTASGTAAGSCSMAPTPITLTSGGTATSTLTVLPTAGTSGTLSVVVTGTSGTTIVASNNIAVSVTPSTFTVTPTSLSLSIPAGATTGNTDVITLASTGVFAGNVSLTCSAVTASGTAAGTCSVAPTPVTLTAGGTGTSTLTVLPTAGTSGTLTVVVTGTSGATVVASSNIAVTVTTPSFTVVPTSLVLTIPAGATSGNTDVISLASTGGFAGSVALTCTATTTTGTAAGTCSVAPTPVTLTSGGTGTSTLTVLPTTGTSGTLTVVVTGTSGATVVSSSNIVVTVTTPSFTVTPASLALSILAGATTGNTDVITLASTNGFAGSVALTCTAVNATGTAAGTCSVAPTPVTLASGGTGTSTLTVLPTAGTSGTLTVVVTGTSGTTVVSSSNIAVTVPTPSFTVTPASLTLSIVQGSATTGNTDVITLASTNGFAGSVALTCTAVNATGTSAGTCSVAPTPVTLASGGTGTSTLTVLPTAGTSGTLTVVVKGTSGSTVVSSSNIAVTVPAATFTLSATAVTLTSGATTGNASTVTITSVNGFAGSVTLSCSISSGSAAFPPTCNAPAAVTVAAGGTATGTITINSTTAQASQVRMAELYSWGAKSGTLFAGILCLFIIRKRHTFRSLAIFVLLAGGLATLTGCGGGGNGPTSPKSSAGTYTVTVNGTGTTTGATTPSTATTTFTLTIN